MGRGVFFGWGASFLSGEGGAPWGASVLMWRVFEKNCKMGGGGCAGGGGGGGPPPPPPRTMENPATYRYFSDIQTS